MPAHSSPEHSLGNLKEQLNSLQEKIAELEGKETPHVKELFSWESPERVFVKRDKRWFANIAILVFILLVIALFFKEFLLMGVILAVLFVVYVLATVPPVEIRHRVTNQGITSHDHSYLWEELSDFWFNHRHGHTVLHIATNLRFPMELTLIIKEEDKEKLQDLLVKYVPFREIAPESWPDKLGQWFSQKLSSI